MRCISNLMAISLLFAFCGNCALGMPEEGRIYTDYEECFRAMVGPGYSDADIFKHAVESTMDRLQLENGTDDAILIFRLEYMNGPHSAIRGASGNGSFFLFVTRESGFEYVGMMAGSSYRKIMLNGRLRLVASWHMSAEEAIETVHEWNGKVFEVVEKKIHRHDPNGSKTELKDLPERER